MKKFLSGFVLASILFTSIPAIAQGIYKTIYVNENSVKIIVNSKQITTPNFIVKGTTYVPLRAISESLGQNVTWDGNTSTVYIGGDSGSLTTAQKYDRILKGSTLSSTMYDNDYIGGYIEVYELSPEAKSLWNSLTENEKKSYLDTRTNELRLKVKTSVMYSFSINEKLISCIWSSVGGYKYTL